MVLGIIKFSWRGIKCERKANQFHKNKYDTYSMFVTYYTKN